MHAMHGNSVIPEALSAVLGKKFRAEEVHIYTDGSFKEGLGAWAVVDEETQPMGGCIPEKCQLTGSTTTELFAITKALGVIKSSPNLRRPKKVTVFSDSAEAIKFGLGLNVPTSGTFDAALADEIAVMMDALEDEYAISLRWVKAHEGIEGNERADAIAGYFVEEALKNKKSRNKELSETSAPLPIQARTADGQSTGSDKE